MADRDDNVIPLFPGMPIERPIRAADLPEELFADPNCPDCLHKLEPRPIGDGAGWACTGPGCEYVEMI